MSRNVDLLAQILGEFWGEGTGIYPIAQFMAAKGVLAVDSLTDDDLVTIEESATWEMVGPDFPEEGERVRAALRRCATGEAE